MTTRTAFDLGAILGDDGELAGWSRGSPGSRSRYVAVPRFDDIRQLLPWRWTSVRATAHRRSDDRSLAKRGRDVAGAALLVAESSIRRHRRAGFSGSGTLIDHLAVELGVPGARGIVLCGPPRANQKPVIQLHDGRGRTVAYVKVAWNELTRGLVATEQRALRHVAARTDRIAVPEILAAGEYRDTVWLALAPVRARHPRPPSASSLAEAAAAIERTGRPWTGAAPQSTFVKRLADRAAGLDRSATVVAALLARDGALPVSEGGAHGDFVPWNIESGEPAPAVWDWERYRADGLLGYDRLHHRLQVALHRTPEPFPDALQRIAGDLVTTVPDLSPHQRARHFDWYLADLMCRYERDLRDNPAPHLPQFVTDISEFLEDRSE